jgi:anti-anti-sigma factor
VERLEPFSIREERNGAVVVLHLAGDLDIDTTRVIDEWLESLTGPLDELVFDLARLSFCDSSGLHRFVAARNRAEERGASFVLRSPQPMVRRLVELAQLDGYLRLDG